MRRLDNPVPLFRLILPSYPLTLLPSASGYLPAYGVLLEFALVTGVIASTMYTWITMFDSFSAYACLPVSVSTHARYEVARICIPAGWLRWWRLFVDQWVPKRKPGRPVTQAVDSA